MPIHAIPVTAMPLPPDISTTTIHNSANYLATITALGDLDRWMLRNGIGSVSEISRRYAGTLWRSFEYPYMTASSCRSSAADYLIGAGVEFRHRRAARTILLSDYPTGNAAGNGVFAPTNLIEAARLNRYQNGGGYIVSTRLLDLAMDATAGWCLLNGSSRATMYARMLTVHSDRLIFGHSVADIVTDGDDDRRRRQVQDAFYAAKNDLSPRYRCTHAQILLARQAQFMLAVQYQTEVSSEQLFPIDRALRVWLLRWLNPDLHADDVVFGEGQTAEMLREYYELESLDDDGSVAFDLFVRDGEESDDADDEDDEERRTSSEELTGVGGTSRQEHKLEDQRRALDRAIAETMCMRETAERCGGVGKDEVRSLAESDFRFASAAELGGVQDLAELAATQMNTSGFMRYSGSIEPDPRSCAEIALDFQTIPITIK